jgi:hypothetical protein
MRRGMLALAHFTGWQYGEILDMPFDEFAAFLAELPKENEPSRNRLY